MRKTATGSSQSAFGRSRAAGPVKAVRSMADPHVQPALEFAHHDNLRKRVPHREDFDSSMPAAPESPVGAQHDRLRKAVPGHFMNGDTDHLMHDTGGLRTYTERPESPVGAHRDRLRKAAPSLELPPRYYLDATDPSSPKGMYSGVGERPTRHSERSRGAGAARPTTSDRTGWIEGDTSFKYQDPEDFKSKGRRMYSANAHEKLKPEDHMAELMRGGQPEANASLPHSASESATPGTAGEEVAKQDPRVDRSQEQQQRRTARITGRDNLREPDRGIINVLDSRHRDALPSADHSTARDLVVGQRILGQLLARKDKLRSVLPLMDSTCTGRVSYQDFSDGLRSAGIILGEADRRSVWSDAGGSLVSRGAGRQGERVPAGEVSIATFVSRLEHSSDGDDWGKKKMSDDGYSQHMRSSLTKGLVVRDDVEQFDPTGGGMHLRRGYASSENSPPPQPPHGVLPGEGSAGAKRTASPMRWSKTEEHHRELIKQRKDALKEMFGVKAPGGEPGGSALSFNQFKGGIRTAGISLSDADVEMLWRRVDSECLGLVNYEHVARAFDLTDRRSVGEPGGSRALPHFREAAPESAHELPLERGAANFTSSLSAERIARALVGGALAPGHTSCSINHEGGKLHITTPAKAKAKAGSQGKKVWDVVKESLAGHPQHVPLDADVLHRALSAAGAVISKTDSEELWQRARQIAGKKRARAPYDASPTVDDLQAVMTAAAQLQTPSKELALLSYGSRVSTAAEAQASAQVADGPRPAEGVIRDEARAALDRLASSFLGNPHRLRQVFKKFDLDLQGSISRDEFERGLLDQWTSLSHHDVQHLGAAAQNPDGVVHYETFCKLVAAAPSGRGRAASPLQQHQQEPRDSRPDTDAISHHDHTHDVPYASRQGYARGSPRGPPSSAVRSPRAGAGAGGAEMPRGSASPGRGAELAPAGEARPRSVQRERSTGSVRSRASGVSAAGSLGGSGPSDRSSWMQDKATQPRRIVRSSSPAPSPSRARPGTPSGGADHAPSAGSPRRPSSPSAARAVQYGGNEAANPFAGAGRDGAATTRILHLAGGPPLAARTDPPPVHRPRSISVVVG